MEPRSEDEIDAADGRRAIAEARAKGEQPIPWEQVKRELALTDETEAE